MRMRAVSGINGFITDDSSEPAGAWAGPQDFCSVIGQTRTLATRHWRICPPCGQLLEAIYNVRPELPGEIRRIDLRNIPCAGDLGAWAGADQVRIRLRPVLRQVDDEELVDGIDRA